MALDDVVLVTLAGVVVLVVAVLIWMSKLSSDLKSNSQRVDNAISSIQALAPVANGMTATLSNLQQETSNIKQQAQIIADIGAKYKDTENLTRRIHSIMIGSYSKGRTGEQVLKSMLGELMRAGIVRQNVYIKTNVVEYGVALLDGKILPLDSKMVGTADLERLHDEATSEEERNEIAKGLIKDIRKKIPEVAAYIQPGMTVPYALMAIPDSLVEYAPEIIGEASSMNVIITGYSSVPSFIEYIYRFYSAYQVPKDVETITVALSKVETSLNSFNNSFFANRIERPMNTLNKAIYELKAGVTSVLQDVKTTNHGGRTDGNDVNGVKTVPISDIPEPEHEETRNPDS